MGTNEGGLIKWFPKTGKYDHFTVATGLSDNVIHGILEDEAGYLWLSSNYGLMRFDKTTKWSPAYLPRDGIAAEKFNTLSYYKSASGQLYFGGVNGMVAFYPSHFQKKGKTDALLHVLKYEYLKGD